MINISQIMPNYKGRSINRQNSSVLSRTVLSLPSNIVGGVSGLIRSDLKLISNKINSCGSKSVVAYHKSGDKVLEMNRCGIHKICPVCADAVSGKRIKKIDSSLAENYDSAQYAYMMTFTIKDGSNLDDRMNVLSKGYRRWYLQGRRRGDHFSIGESSKISGASKSIEIKIGQKSGVWHPHIHSIAFTSEQIDFRVYDEKVRARFDIAQKEKHSVDFKKFMVENDGVLFPFVENTERLRDLYSSLYGTFNYVNFSKWRIEKACTFVQLFKKGKMNLNFTADSKLVREWRIATDFEGSNLKVNVLYTPKTRPQKYISFIKSFEKSNDINFNGEKMSALKAVKYSLKYSVKAGDFEKMSPEQVFTLFDVSRKHRSIEYGGFLRGKKEVESISLEYSPLSEHSKKAVNDGLIVGDLDCRFPLLPDELEYDDYRRFCVDSDLGTYETNNRLQDNKIMINEKQIEYYEQNKHYNDMNFDYETRVLLSDQLKAEPVDSENREEIEKMLYGVKRPELLLDFPNGEISQALSAEYFWYDSGRIKGDRGRVALYQLGADFQKIFHREVTAISANYRSGRTKLFEKWNALELTNQQYISAVESSRADLKTEIHRLKLRRDRRIDERSKGLYSMILDSVKGRTLLKVA